jgi:signal transduction histidine kinase
MAAPEPSFELATSAARQLRAALDQEPVGASVDGALAAIADSVVVGGFADWCTLEVIDEGTREVRLVAVAHRDRASVARARTAHGTGDLGKALGWSASHAAPLITRGRHIGVLTLAAEKGELAEGVSEKAAALAGLMASGIETALLCAERDEMLSVVSHDLRNPLGVILLVIDLLRGMELPDEIAGQMQRLERASQTMSRIITDVVDIGRLGTPGVPLEIRQIEAVAAIDEACEASAALAEARHVTFELAVEPELEVAADRARLGRALDLLISGAVSRTPANRTVAIGAVRDGDRVIWSVADGAPPLPPDPSVPATGPAAIRRRTGAFTWMVVRGVVRAHGGSVWLEETPTRVTIRFSLPDRAAGQSVRAG